MSNTSGVSEQNSLVAIYLWFQRVFCSALESSFQCQSLPWASKEGGCSRVSLPIGAVVQGKSGTRSVLSKTLQLCICNQDALETQSVFLGFSWSLRQRTQKHLRVFGPDYYSWMTSKGVSQKSVQTDWQVVSVCRDMWPVSLITSVQSPELTVEEENQLILWLPPMGHDVWMPICRWTPHTCAQ